MVKSRDTLVSSRTRLINHAQGVVKTTGERLPVYSSASCAKRCAEHVPDQLRSALEPIFEAIVHINEQIRDLDKKIDQLCREQYPETQRLQQVPGAGPITALSYILSIEDQKRFAKSRQVGPFLGLTPRRDQSGRVDKQLPITKAGNRCLRRLLVGSAQYILEPFGPDSELRRHGLSIAVRGGKNGKRRAAVAMARKLSVLLHRLWVSEQDYEPFYSKVYKKAT